MRSEGYSTCLSVCVSATLFSHLAQLRGKQEIRATSASHGQQNEKGKCFVRKLERYELTVRNIRSAILSHVRLVFRISALLESRKCSVAVAS